MQHFTVVNRINNRYEATCNICGVIATSPTQKGKMEQVAAKHDGRPIPAINHRGPRAGKVVVEQDPSNWTKKQWYDFVHKNPAATPKLGQGVSRKCYALDDKRVIKIEYTLDKFYDQCASEVRVWNNASAEKRQYLATILEHGEGWTIMERARMTISGFNSHDVTRTISNDLRATTGIGDLHGGNIGYFGNGQFKVIDYAL